MAALIVLAFIADPLSGLKVRFTDAIVQKPSAVSERISVVGIDEKTLGELGPFASWSRDGLAQLIEVMTADKEFMPKIIAVDVGFYGESQDPESDKRLADACAKAGNVIVGSNVVFGKTVKTTDSGTGAALISDVVAFEAPYAALGESVKHGFTNVPLDSDGVARRSYLHLEIAEGVENSFAYEIYRAYTGETALPPLNANGQWLIRFTGKPGDYFGPTGGGNSFIDVLNDYEYFYKYIFADQIVFVGAYAAGLMDNYLTPIQSDTPMYGVEIHANILEALIKGNFVTESPRAYELIALIAVLALVYFITLKLDFRVAGVITLALAGGMYAASRLLFNQNILFSPLYPMAGALLIYTFACLQNYLSETRERRKVMDLLSRYLSPQVAKTLAASKNAVNLAGEKRDIAVLFVDIRGFTTLSESMPPDKVVEFLNKYLELTTLSIFGNEGTVDKFIGDATMGLFNAPMDLDDYVYKCVKAGMDMVEGARRMGDELILESGKRVGFGVGIHCGEAVVGNIGPRFRMDYTAIGDTVNTASRLEGQAKAGEVVISAEVYNRLKGRVQATCLGEVKLKGKAEGFTVYKVEGLE